MKTNFFDMTRLQYKVKSLEAQVEAFQSGEVFRSMKAELMQQLRAVERKLQAAKQELADARREFIKMRNNWMQVNEDLVKECDKRIQVWVRRFGDMEKRALNSEGACDDWHDKHTQKQREIYQVQIELEEERGKNQKLIAQMNRDYEKHTLHW